MHNDMTISKKNRVMPAIILKQGVVVLAAAAVSVLAGCGSVGSLLGGGKVDYKSAGKAAPLDVPPDLTQLQRENRYAIPETNRGVATASSYTLQTQGARGVTGKAEPEAGSVGKQVAPGAVSNELRIERAGSQRWLVVKQKSEVLFPLVKEFWQDSGFLISSENPEIGVMETEWAENRAKIPQDAIRNVIGKVLDSLYSTGERDKYRTRLERTADGGTEIFISHRGAEEVLVGQYKETASWTSRPSDPALESEFLTRLMVRLGVNVNDAKTALADAKAAPLRSKLIKANDGAYLEIDEGYDRAWRRIGLALDRVGFAVEDRDRIQGLYYVRYVDQVTDVKAKGKNEKGVFGKLFSWGSSNSEKAKDQDRYKVAVKVGGDTNITQVLVLGLDNKVANTDTGNKILALLNDQLK